MPEIRGLLAVPVHRSNSRPGDGQLSSWPKSDALACQSKRPELLRCCSWGQPKFMICHCHAAAGRKSPRVCKIVPRGSFDSVHVRCKSRFETIVFAARGEWQPVEKSGAIQNGSQIVKSRQAGASMMSFRPCTSQLWGDGGDVSVF
jgi:hypothetical protein